MSGLGKDNIFFFTFLDKVVSIFIFPVNLRGTGQKMYRNFGNKTEILTPYKLLPGQWRTAFLLYHTNIYPSGVIRSFALYYKENFRRVEESSH